MSTDKGGVCIRAHPCDPWSTSQGPTTRRTNPTMMTTHKIPRSVSVLLLGMLAWLTPALARAQSGAATIEGRVFNQGSGSYVNNARVVIEALKLETFTDEQGQYRLSHVPAGDVVLRVFFTGQPAQVVTLTVPPGATIQQDITLAASPAAGRGDTVKLAEFVVSASREMAASAIAINEQRFAPNIKNVLSTDEFGFVPEGNAAEFLKFLPGITIESAGGNSRNVSINGVPAANVPITLDGFNVASSSVGDTNTGRTVAMDMVSVNNLSRIEVEYSPTPESQGAALAGTVNMVPRSAFERSRPFSTVAPSS